MALSLQDESYQFAFDQGKLLKLSMAHPKKCAEPFLFFHHYYRSSFPNMSFVIPLAS
jgi:hypothetical protein